MSTGEEGSKCSFLVVSVQILESRTLTLVVQDREHVREMYFVIWRQLTVDPKTS